jgi:hypothetical protein
MAGGEVKLTEQDGFFLSLGVGGFARGLERVETSGNCRKNSATRWPQSRGISVEVVSDDRIYDRTPRARLRGPQKHALELAY